MKRLNWMNKQMLTNLGNLIFILSPALGYIPQIYARDIIFSPLLSLILIIGAILKLFYHIADPLKTPVLFQTFVVLMTQLYLIYNYKHTLGVIEERIYLNGISDKLFFKYGIFYINMMIITCVVSIIRCLGLYNKSIYYKCGIIGVMLESSVGVVQICIRRTDKKYLIGKAEKKLPKELFFCWIIGDFAKLFWMYKMKSQKFLIFPVWFQIVVDVILLFE